MQVTEQEVRRNQLVDEYVAVLKQELQGRSEALREQRQILEYEIHQLNEELERLEREEEMMAIDFYEWMRQEAYWDQKRDQMTKNEIKQYFKSLRVGERSYQKELMYQMLTLIEQGYEIKNEQEIPAFLSLAEDNAEYHLNCVREGRSSFTTYQRLVNGKYLKQPLLVGKVTITEKGKVKQKELERRG